MATDDYEHPLTPEQIADFTGQPYNDIWRERRFRHVAYSTYAPAALPPGSPLPARDSSGRRMPPWR